MNQTFAQVAAHLPSTLDDVRKEREYQYDKWSTQYSDDDWGAMDWDIFIDKYKSAALVAGINGNVEEFKKQMIKVAALAVAAVESAKRTDKISK